MTNKEILQSHYMYIREGYDIITIAQHFDIHPEQLKRIWRENPVREIQEKVKNETKEC